MRRSSYATFPGGLRRKRQKTPRWPPGWGRKLDASWTSIARIKDALYQADRLWGVYDRKHEHLDADQDGPSLHMEPRE